MNEVNPAQIWPARRGAILFVRGSSMASTPVSDL
jgi:hypothetical protein